MRKTYKDVDTYIADAPKEIRGKLKELRAIIKTVAPKAEERISWGMPSYIRKGFGYQKGGLASFAVFKNHVSIFISPSIVEEHQKELKGYTTTKSAIHFAFDKPLPVALIKKLIKARVKKNEEEKMKICSRGHSYLGSGPCPACWPGRNKK